jgi:hypothetical protein
MSYARLSWVAVAVAGSVSLLCLTSGRSHADDFSDIRIPKNRSLLWTLSLSANGNHNDGNNPVGTGTAGSFGANGSSQIQWLSDSDPAFTSIFGRLAFSGSRFGNEFDERIEQLTGVSTEEDARHQTAALESWELGFEHRRYPSPPPIFLSLRARGLGRYEQQWADDRRVSTLYPASGPQQRAINEQSLNQAQYTYRLSAGAGLGVGRVRDATGVYEALVLEQRLRETGALTRDLSPQARRRLADLMYVRDGFDFVHERPGRDIWQELERILADDGALASGGIDPYSVLRAEEPHFATGGVAPDGLPRSPVARQSGVLVSLFVEGNSSHDVQHFEFSSFTQQAIDDSIVAETRITASPSAEPHHDFSVASLEGSYHRPLGVHWQLDALTRASVPLRKEESSFQWFTGASATWLVSDRWLGSTFFSQSWFDADRIGDSELGDELAWNVGANWGYYLEDDLLLTLSASAEQRHTHINSLPGLSSTTFSRSENVSLALTYRFSGWFEAPGMFPAATRP